MSDEEWNARVELAACYRVLDLLGWSEVIFNHVTLRIPGPDARYLINPFGLLYREVRASNLVAVDLDGNIVGRSDWPVNPAGFVVHGAFHDAVPDARCVMHVHTTAGLAVACAREGLVDCNFYSAQLRGEVAYHDFEGIVLRSDEKARLVRDMGSAHAMVLRNHGLLTVGIDIPQAFAFMWTLQRACEVQLAARTLGEVIHVPEAISRQASRDAFQFDPRMGAARTMFDALVREADRVDPSFRT
jgi:ribulose-5-phosphate 4-epimerase/fuculose-1-phosphate aldolase